MTTISELSRSLNVCRKTVRDRIKDGWSVSRIKQFYSKKKRVREKPSQINVQEKIQRIEVLTGESFETTIKKILIWTTDKSEIASALELSPEELESCIRAELPALMLRMK